MPEIEINEADVDAAKEYFRHIGSIDDCRVGPSHIKELAEEFAAHRIASATAATTAERERCEKITRRLLDDYSSWNDGVGMKEHGPGGHGSCCMCGTCKHHYDDCVCDHNEIEAALITAFANQVPQPTEARDDQ
jgi:hypothetical protein